MNIKKSAKVIIYIAAASVFLIPILKLIMFSFNVGNGYGFQNYTAILNDSKTYKAFLNTIIISFFSTILSMIIGTAFAWIVAYTDVKHKKLIEFLVLLPYIIPSYIITLSWTQLMAEGGITSHIGLHINMYSIQGIIIVMGICNSALVYLLTVNTLRKIPRDTEYAANVCGAGGILNLLKINIPQALSGILGGCLLSFLSSIDNFAIPAVLGIPSGINVLSTYIYQNIVGFGPSSFSKAAAISVILGVVAVLGTFLQGHFSKKSRTLETVKEDFTERVHLGKYKDAVQWTTLGILIAINIVPMITIFANSLIKPYTFNFNRRNLTFNNFILVLQDGKTKDALLNSFLLAALCTVICIIVGTTIAYIKIRKNTWGIKLIEMSISLTYALPGTVLALALILFWASPLPNFNPGIYGTVKMLIIAYISRYLVLQSKGSHTTLSQVEVSMEQSSSICGAGNFYKWTKILIPMILKDVLSSSFLVFISSLTEVTMSSVLSSAGSETIGLVIFNYEQSGNLTYATSFSSIVILIIFLVYVILKEIPKLKMKGDKYEYEDKRCNQEIRQVRSA